MIENNFFFIKDDFATQLLSTEFNYKVSDRPHTDSVFLWTMNILDPDPHRMLADPEHTISGQTWRERHDAVGVDVKCA